MQGYRLIPAYAGKTEMDLIDHLGLWAHPRVCGENCHAVIVIVRTQGSSPRMRGKLGDKTISILRVWLIPAYAGKTFSLEFLRKNPGAHPRVCGENK